MTVFAFPQDIWLFPGDYAFYLTSYQRQPWWGDVDQPDLRPSNTYLLTGERIGVEGSNDFFRHESNIYNWKNIAGFSKTLTPTLRVRFDLEYMLSPLRSSAQGAMTNGANTLKFDYSERHSIHDAYLTTYLATTRWKYPLGMKIGAGFVSSLAPRLDFTVSENGVAVTAQRMMWAWSASQGGRVFDDYPGDEHAATQDNYTSGSLFRFDLQGAMTLPRLKWGARLRYNGGELDQYNWVGENSSGSVAARYDLTGSYRKSVAKKISEKTIRAYGNYTWIKRDKFNFNTLVLSRYTVCDSAGVLPQNTGVPTGVHEKARTFVFQINPNVNIYPWNYTGTFVDLAILCNYAHMSYDFTRPYWVSGGQKDSYANTHVYAAEDYYWQDFSYARQNFVEVAFDANPVFPVFGSKEQSVALGLNVLLWTRFKWLNKYYGETQTGTSDLTFDVQNIRRNFEREVWLNTVLNVIYRRGGRLYRLWLGQPLTYSLNPVTRVYDGSGDNLQTEIKHENMWVSQAGAQVGFFVSVPLSQLAQRRSTGPSTRAVKPLEEGRSLCVR